MNRRRRRRWKGWKFYLYHISTFMAKQRRKLYQILGLKPPAVKPTPFQESHRAMRRLDFALHRITWEDEGNPWRGGGGPC